MREPLYKTYGTTMETLVEKRGTQWGHFGIFPVPTSSSGIAGLHNLVGDRNPLCSSAFLIFGH